MCHKKPFPMDQNTPQTTNFGMKTANFGITIKWESEFAIIFSWIEYEERREGSQVSIGEIVYKTLIEGDSYRTLLKGLGMTFRISLFSVLLGTLLGMVVCALRRSRFWPVRSIAAGYIAIVRGSPVVLLLMLMYYVVFAGSGVSAVIVAVAAFSLHMSAYTAACFYSALNATDAMQAEAARTLGFSRWQAFTLITLPQAANIAKGTYQSTVVTLIQWTSVAGYVTITDLTRVINNIGSRTMQPLFMILVGLLLYLGMAYICYGVFALVDRLSALRRKRRRTV